MPNTKIPPERKPLCWKTILLPLWMLLGLGACTNPKVPEGHEGYVYHRPLVFGKVTYRKSLRGPSSTGASWRLFVTNIDMRTRSYKEVFRLLTRDNLSVEFEVNTRISLRPGSVKEIVERWGGKRWYLWNVKEPSRTIVRRMVTQVSAIDIQLKTEMVRGRIRERLLTKYKKTPIRIESVDIGNIRFPKEVTQAIERKIGQQQELQRQEYLLAKTKKEAAIRVLEALKAAKQQMIISATLDPLYVQRQAIQVYRLLAQSPNKTILVLPNTSDGTGMPLVLSSAKRKLLSPADRQLLKDIERRYMQIARHSKRPQDRPGAGSAPDPRPAPAAPAAPASPGGATSPRGAQKPPAGLEEQPPMAGMRPMGTARTPRRPSTPGPARP